MNRRELFEREIKKITEKITREYKPEKIILYGSCARGKVTRNSDIDMFLIKRTKKSFEERLREVAGLVKDRLVPFEAIVYTPQELERELRLGDFFVEEVLQEGKVLYEKKKES